MEETSPRCPPLLLRSRRHRRRSRRHRVCATPSDNHEGGGNVGVGVDREHHPARVARVPPVDRPAGHELEARDW